MKRSTFLTLVAVVSVAVGLVAIAAPGTFLEHVKHAAPSDAANVMLRTVGVLLLAVGVLNFLVRNHPDSETLRAVLVADLVLQLAIMPIDPVAYSSGAFHTLGSFVPNTILHVVLAAGLSAFLLRMRRTPRTA